MITALDSNVLIDVFGGDPRFGPASRDALRVCMSEGALVACPTVWAEVGAHFPSIQDERGAMETLGVAFSSHDHESALEAAGSWRTYRTSGGTRQRVIADFLIGAHAMHHAERLLTRDRGFYRAYFPEVKLFDPAAE